MDKLLVRPLSAARATGSESPGATEAVSRMRVACWPVPGPPVAPAVAPYVRATLRRGSARPPDRLATSNGDAPALAPARPLSRLRRRGRAAA